MLEVLVGAGPESRSQFTVQKWLPGNEGAPSAYLRQVQDGEECSPEFHYLTAT